MKSVIERYNKYTMKLSMEKSQINAFQNDNMRQKEVTRMKQEINDLQNSNRRLTGEDLSASSPKELEHLEKIMETRLHRVREKKDQILIDELEELNRKERFLYEENKKLRKMISMVESSSVAGTMNGICLPSINCSEVESETAAAAISVLDFSLQLNQPDHSQSHHVTSRNRVAAQLW